MTDLLNSTNEVKSSDNNIVYDSTHSGIGIGQLHNNIGILSLSIYSVLSHCNRMALTKVLLIPPLISNSELLSYLAHKSTNIRSIEQLVIKKTRCLSNFNSRFYDTLVTSVNSIQLLSDLELIKFQEGFIEIINPLQLDGNIGKRAQKIIKSAKNINTILQPPASVLYLNLRVQI